MSDSSPGELAGKSFPHLAGALGDTAFKSQAEIAALIAKRTDVGGVLRRAARRCRRAHRLAAQGGRSRGHASRASSTSRRTSVSPRPRPTRRSTSIAHGAPHRLAQFTCAVPEHLKKVTDAARRRIRAASPRPSCWPACRCWRPARPSPRCSSAASPAAPAPAASPSKARITRRATAISIPTARSATAIRPRSRRSPRPPPASMRSSRSCRIPGPFARGIHATVQARLKIAARCGAAVVGMLREYYAGCAVRARARQRAAREGHRRQQLRASVRRGQWHARSP